MVPLLTLAFVLGALAAGAWARLHFRWTLRTFRCKVRLPGSSRWTSRPWPRGKVRAAWIHDTLLFQRGLLRPRTVVLAARGCDRAIRPADRFEVSRLGRHPVVLSLWLHDGRTVDVAARRRDTAVLAGPFVAAAMAYLPDAPNEHRPR